MLLLIFVLNLAISLWNAYTIGTMWSETKIVGGWARFISWCGTVMAASGLTWCYIIVYGYVGLAGGYLNRGDFELLLQMGYLLIVLPVVGSGFGIWIDSLVQAYQRRSFGSVGVAGYNTFAQARNVKRLDPGIRDLVVYLRALGFETTDSGDGYSKPSDERVFHMAHVAIRCEPWRIVEASDHLLLAVRQFVENLKNRGDDLQTADDWVGDWHVETSYCPNDKSCVMLVMLAFAEPDGR